MLVTMKQLLDTAKGRHFAVAAPNVFSLETIEQALKAARELNAPIILNIWDDGPAGGLDWIRKYGHTARFLAQTFYPDVVAAINLDHGLSFDAEMAAIQAGFTSVMSDRSSLPFEENIAEVRKIVDAAHAVGVSVEAELGQVGDGFEYEQKRDAGLTRPEQAQEYVRRTGCDMLAVAVGTSHGTYRGTPRIAFDLLQELNDLIDIPLVLHGGSSTGDENLAKAVEIGIQKVNVNTDLMNAFTAAQKKAEADGATGFMELYDAGLAGWKAMLIHYMRLFRSDGKADLYKAYSAQWEEPHFAHAPAAAGAESFR